MERLAPIFNKLYSKFPYIGNLLFVDVETTGLESDARLIEIGAIATSYDGFDVNFDTFEILINPGVQIVPKITEITGITNEELANAPDEAVAYCSFFEWLKNKDITKCVAHNAQFDEGKLKYNLMRTIHTYPLPPFECTMRMSKQNLRGPKNDKLGTLCEWFNFVNSQAHRALADTEACAYVYGKISLGEY